MDEKDFNCYTDPYGGLVIEFFVPETPHPVLDKPWPVVPPLPTCKQILCCSCNTHAEPYRYNALYHTTADTLEEACFDRVEYTQYDGTEVHRQYRSEMRRHRTSCYIGITDHNQVIQLQTATNHMCEPPRVMGKWDIPAGAPYLYIGSVNTPDLTFCYRFLFDVDERRLHQRLLRMAKHADSFNFLKVSTRYAHRSDYEFYAVYYRGDYISPEDQAVIDALNAFPKDDPLAFYDACMQHVPGESYDVDRDGNRTNSTWTTGYALEKGIVDFTTPETYRKMTQFTVNTYEWERYTSQMEQDNDFGNLYTAGRTDI